jgi:hypothetical protein
MQHILCEWQDAGWERERNPSAREIKVASDSELKSIWDFNKEKIQPDTTEKTWARKSIKSLQGLRESHYH